MREGDRERERENKKKKSIYQFETHPLNVHFRLCHPICECDVRKGYFRRRLLKSRSNCRTGNLINWLPNPIVTSQTSTFSSSILIHSPFSFPVPIRKFFFPSFVRYLFSHSVLEPETDSPCFPT